MIHRYSLIMFGTLLLVSVFGNSNIILGQDQEELRKELIQELDRRLANFRQEMITEIDKKLGVKSKPVFLGISVRPVTEGLRRLLDLGGDQGALIYEVTPGSPAEKAGLKRMDILVAFKGVKIGSPEDLNNTLKKCAEGESVEVTILRLGNQKKLKVTLGALTSESLPKPPEEKEKPESLAKPAEGKKEKKEIFTELEDIQKRVEEFLKNRKLKDKDKAGENEKGKEDKDEIDKLLRDLDRDKKPEKKDLKDIEEGKTYLGVSLMPVSPMIRNQLGLGEGEGILVGGVQQGSPADKAGIKKWDVILSIGTKEIGSIDDMLNALNSMKPGQEVEITLIRYGKKIKCNATLGSKKS